MKLWYNFVMKILIKLLLIFLMTVSCAQAETFNVIVLPTDLLNQKENYYSFSEPSEIFAQDIISNFYKEKDKISSPDLYKVREKISANADLKNSASTALKKYENIKNIDYQALKKIGDSCSCEYILLVSSSVYTKQNNLKRNLWEILNISTAFDISYPYRLETTTTLIDTTNDLVIWSNKYTTKIGNNSNYFIATNYAQANEQLDKIRMYSKNVIAPSTSQNITLRFFPKTVRTIDKDIKDSNGGALNFEKTIPEAPKGNSEEEFFGETIYGI